jgi:hypothetical protein
MLIVQLDEPGLFVFSSTAEAVRALEPIDAESKLRAAFDEGAVPYRVNWLQPNRESRVLFGLLRSVAQGRYELVPAGPPQPAALRALLESQVTDPEPPQSKHEFDKLLAQLRAV